MVVHTLLSPLTVTITLGLLACMNIKFSSIGLNTTLGEYVLVYQNVTLGFVPAAPPVSLLPDRTISGTLPVY